VNARREPKPRAPEEIPEHVFAPNPYGPRDHHQKPTECLFAFGGKHCQLPPGNAVHKSSEELVADLPPTPDEDVSDRIIGEIKQREVTE
jgi:hypothetical protein